MPTIESADMSGYAKEAKSRVSGANLELNSLKKAYSGPHVDAVCGRARAWPAMAATIAMNKTERIMLRQLVKR